MTMTLKIRWHPKLIIQQLRVCSAMMKVQPLHVSFQDEISVSTIYNYSVNII